jgi:hypothetical protein
MRNEAVVTATIDGQSTQANFDVGLWQQIGPQLSAYYPGTPAAGGFVFEFNDEIWKVGNYNVGLGDVIDHEQNNYAFYDPHGYYLPGGAPDSILNAEYFGLVDAGRNPKTAYFQLQSLYVNLQSTPTVTITQPQNNSIFTAGSNITLNANATQSSGTITSVSYDQGTSLIGNASTPPYTVIWNNVPAGDYALAAVATNFAGLYSTSTLVNISVVSTNPAPILSSMDPNGLLSGHDSFTLTVNGSNFVNTAVVQWNGSPLATTYLNGNTVTAIVPAQLVIAPGRAWVAVFNPAPGGGTSNSAKFMIGDGGPVRRTSRFGSFFGR